MKALSVKQPWAWLLANGFKDIENRSWHTKIRGNVLIHASKGMTRKEYAEAKELCDKLGVRLPQFEDLDRGCIVGMMEIFDSVDASDSPWYFGQVGFCVRKARPCNPIPMKGKLSFFETGIEAEDLKWIRRKTK
ncbi:putative ASCH domain-containing protein [Dickeya phage vB_DsoM_JA33]|uniref:Putative ASCH domain-containing protein n=3 Tax=Salmondvirus JA11 TaxID=2734141 RepID=A0A384ZW40_9CAUD|nr:putative ASCH domain-containing protein [Dickeya phage vB_DsoM_JA11]AXG66458.1 putative ASCH domain-containing protein [Dickeya phage vB_DsoM_JA13]AXG67428.1 putative ASCH domain-containing protein [Dickeya phage vB_DsoM_JA33]AYD79859.1 putative ASCH domain-containing protein [Dickeya phage vB_DsoM_JA11]